MAPTWFTLSAATVVGFAFFLMEMVWYRMLGPILGGTVFTFGLILGIALLGIGLGGAFYGVVGSKRPATLLGFAYTCLAEAVLMILPYALGDRVATLTLMLRPLGLFGFSGLLSGWTLVTLLVVAPAAFVSGVQFPMLIALLGRGRESVGSQIGLAYAFNTIGAIAGSLAGGFGLMPLLTAPGCWRLVACMLGGLGLLAWAVTLRRERAWFASAVPVALALACGFMLRAEGPTAVWRHSPIGVGRVDAESTTSARALRGWMNDERRAVVWEREGVESTVALNTSNGWAFVVNGKIDGSIRGDAPTQVMGGLVGAMLHPEPKDAMVIGLGTGSTAGWLGSVPSISEVDVVEFEPAVLWVARRCLQVNQNVMENPKVRITIGDAREVLVTTKKQYDIVFSEPSNPYRAGIASLFTREYYEAIADRLRDRGILLQWVQAYNVDAQAVRTIYATLGSVFPEVETWELAANDLLLVASKTPLAYDVDHLRNRIAREPFKTALLSSWRAVDVEGFLAHYVAGAGMARAIADAERGRLNTDDQTLVEFGFARTASDRTALSSADIRKTAHARADDRPARLMGDVDLTHLEDEWMAFLTAEETQEEPPDYFTADQKARARAEWLYVDGDWSRLLASWRTQPREPVGPIELAVMAESLASLGDDRARSYIDKLRNYQPTEADAIAARWMTRRKSPEQAATFLESAFRRYRRDPWPLPSVMRHAFDTLTDLVSQNPELAERMYQAVSSPFVGYLHEDRRAHTMLKLARQYELHVPCWETLKVVEPHVPWEEDLLQWRAGCYAPLGNGAAATAQREFQQFIQQEPMRFGTGLMRLTAEYAAAPK